MQTQAIVSSNGQVTLPAAMRTQLGIGPGSHLQFELRGRELVIKPELPMGDALMYPLAQEHHATFWTQDASDQGLPCVQWLAKG